MSWLLVTMVTLKKNHRWFCFQTLDANTVLWLNRGIFSLFLSGFSSYIYYHYQNAKISDFKKIEGVVMAMISEYPFNQKVFLITEIIRLVKSTEYSLSHWYFSYTWSVYCLCNAQFHHQLFFPSDSTCWYTVLFMKLTKPLPFAMWTFFNSPYVNMWIICEFSIPNSYKKRKWPW